MTKKTQYTINIIKSNKDIDLSIIIFILSMEHFTISGTLEYNNVVIYDSQHDAYYSVNWHTFRGSQFTRELIYNKLVTLDFTLIAYHNMRASDELTLAFVSTNNVGKLDHCWVDCPRIFPYMHVDLKDDTLTVEDYKRCIRSLQGFIVRTENKLLERIVEYESSERQDYNGYNYQIVNGRIINLTTNDENC